MASLVQGYQLTDVVTGTLVTKSALALPQSATSTLFTVSGGAVLVTGLAGLVTTAVGATATNLSLGTVPTTGTAESSGIANATAITSAAAGTWLTAPITGSQTPSTPAVPATTVNATNNNPYAVSVVISANGATISSVKVNGSQVGTGAGTYVVPSYGTINISYTVATPTWVWSHARQLAVSPGAGSTGLGQHPGGSGAFVVAPGTISWTTSASDTGNISWYLNYMPLDTGAMVS